MNSLGTVTMMNSKHLSLNFSEEQRTQAWQKAQDYSNRAARWNAYINYLCLSVLSNYWKTTETTLSVPEQSNIWEFVNGSVIKCERTQIILIPHEAIDTEEFLIPQEWVDIPDWLGSYYVAVQIIPDDGWLRVWGFSTHAQLKTEGTYDLSTRTYALSRDSLTEEINGLWVLNQLELSETVAVDNLVQLSNEQATVLIDKLSHSQANLPRLALEFSDWGALLSSEQKRHQLYLARLSNAQLKTTLDREITSSKASTIYQSLANYSTRFTHLSHWLNNIIEPGWQSIEELLTSEKMVYALRNAQSQKLTKDLINNLIKQIYTRDQHQQKQAARSLGEVENAETDVIEALSYLIETTTDEETRWTAAESLWTLVPNHPSVGIRKLKNLGIQIGGYYLALMVAILPKQAEKFAILLRVSPMGQQSCLPADLELIVIDEQNQIFLAAKSREIDNYIQLKFSGRREENFRVKLVLQSTEIMENFMI